VEAVLTSSERLLMAKLSSSTMKIAIREVLGIPSTPAIYAATKYPSKEARMTVHHSWISLLIKLLTRFGLVM
jgi:hypothetical protein